MVPGTPEGVARHRAFVESSPIVRATRRDGEDFTTAANQNDGLAPKLRSDGSSVRQLVNGNALFGIRTTQYNRFTHVSASAPLDERDRQSATAERLDLRDRDRLSLIHISEPTRRTPISY